MRPESGTDRVRNGFDKLARPYRWLEYLTCGPMLARVRASFLDDLCDARDALLLGDGDGRFAAALLRANPDVRLCAVDASPAMLRATVRRVSRLGRIGQLRPVCADVMQHLPAGTFDLVCSHFFLDCLSDAQCHDLARRMRCRMRPGAQWVLSEFAVPEGWRRRPATLLIGALYAIFGLLTGLRARALPNYPEALRSAGLTCVSVRTRFGGILRAERWSWPIGAAGGGCAGAGPRRRTATMWSALHPNNERVTPRVEDF